MIIFIEYSSVSIIRDIFVVFLMCHFNSFEILNNEYNSPSFERPPQKRWSTTGGRHGRGWGYVYACVST